MGHLQRLLAFLLTILSISNLLAQEYLQSDSILVEFVGDANLQSVISNGSDNNTTGGLGIVMYRELEISEEKSPLFMDFMIEGSINVASSLDTINLRIDNSSSTPPLVDRISNLSEVGTFILLPSVTKQNAVGSISAYFNSLTRNHWWLKFIHGGKFQIGGSNAGFSVANDKNGQARALDRISLTVMYVRFGLFHEFIPQEKRRINDYSLLAGLDFSGRWMFGDLGQRSLNADRLKFFGTDQRGFFGYEPYIRIKLKNLVAEASLPSLFPEGWRTDSPNDFRGLTNSRLTTTIRFVGGFPLGIK